MVGINQVFKTNEVCRVNATPKFEHSDPALQSNLVIQWVARRVRRYGVPSLGKDYGHYLQVAPCLDARGQRNAAVK